MRVRPSRSIASRYCRSAESPSPRVARRFGRRPHLLGQRRRGGQLAGEQKQEDPRAEGQGKLAQRASLTRPPLPAPPQIRRRADRIVQQRGLPHSNLAAQHQGAAGAGPHLCHQPVQYLTLAPPPEQHARRAHGPLEACQPGHFPSAISTRNCPRKRLLPIDPGPGSLPRASVQTAVPTRTCIGAGSRAKPPWKASESHSDRARPRGPSSRPFASWSRRPRGRGRRPPPHLGLFPERAWSW